MYQFFVDITKALRTVCISSLWTLPKPLELHVSVLCWHYQSPKNCIHVPVLCEHYQKPLEMHTCISSLWTLPKPLELHVSVFCGHYQSPYRHTKINIYVIITPPPPSLLYKTLDLITSWRQNVPSGGHGKACQGRQCSHEATIKKGVKMGKGCYQICWSSNLIIQ